jgi:hypothetical protein
LGPLPSDAAVGVEDDVAAKLQWVLTLWSARELALERKAEKGLPDARPADGTSKRRAAETKPPVDGELGIAVGRHRKRRSDHGKERWSGKRHADEACAKLFTSCSDLDQVLAAGNSANVAHEDHDGGLTPKGRHRYLRTGLVDEGEISK